MEFVGFRGVRTNIRQSPLHRICKELVNGPHVACSLGQSTLLGGSWVVLSYEDVEVGQP